MKKPSLYWIVCAVSLGGLLFPVAVAHTGTYAFAFFAAMMLLEMVWAMLFMPETNGKSIEETL